MATTTQPSLELVLNQVSSERDAINARRDSLDTKASLVLGFSGVLVGLSATATADATYPPGAGWKVDL